MKFTILLVLSLAVLVSCKRDGKDGSPCCVGKIGEFLERIEKTLERNASLNENVIASFRSNGLGQYIITENGAESINFTAVAVNYWTTLPKLANIAAQFNLPERVISKLNEISTRIDQVQTNQTEFNRFVGVLYLTDNNNFVSGCTGQLTVNFAAVASDAEASKILACYVAAGGKHGEMRKGKGKGPVSGRKGKGKGPVSGRKGKGKGPVSGRKGKGKGPVSGRKGKGKGPVSGRKGKGKGPVSGRKGKGKGPVSGRKGKGKGPVSGRKGKGKGPVSGRRGKGKGKEDYEEENSSEQISEEDDISQENSEENNSQESSEENNSQESSEEAEIISEDTESDLLF